ncbi:hypothetical protein M5W83_02460 [Paenibacillus thiaminolyticus]|uniref:DUF5666 domain-containing protein n=1 Tax=Paenibacillus thiaminolyticus TaxID=49283 RepID=A0AAP9DWR4_PANTH|nr:hypothetical protein [Paenibacillus thiaminolyticus]MCY9535060.1 hypothetical protein [Paenibacillus thiaminolyticus]MCY9605191.1 hypothetical protein [Paenibacillus thiaminolyticus]MCY9606042.1 hypothetical protein [Paenibacillus thiaminolyticus]MCY9615652.1 hypothetical protein [Paenibacillus thiaminolyticus]MCY9620445.1 hypothetical protein [Paenibacillus thiaminolyticus]
MNRQRMPWLAACSALLIASGLISGCADNQAAPDASLSPAQTQSSPTGAGTPGEAPADSAAAGQDAASNSDTTAGGNSSAGQSAADDAEVERVLQSIDTGNGCHKKIELLKDGGKRVTITDPNGKATVRKVEYEGMISAVDGSSVTVQLEHGGEKTIEVGNHMIADDETGQGFKAGTEIEWDVDQDGTILNIELDD